MPNERIRNMYKSINYCTAMLRSYRYGIFDVIKHLKAPVWTGPDTAAKLSPMPSQPNTSSGFSPGSEQATHM